MRILFATDGSAPAREGEDLMISLFDRSRAEIRVLAVTPEPHLRSPRAVWDLPLWDRGTSPGRAGPRRRPGGPERRGAPRRERVRDFFEHRPW
jgi:hypothetical protein